jgi:hypothetical protein
VSTYVAEVDETPLLKDKYVNRPSKMPNNTSNPLRSKCSIHKSDLKAYGSSIIQSFSQAQTATMTPKKSQIDVVLHARLGARTQAMGQAVGEMPWRGT